MYCNDGLEGKTLLHFAMFLKISRESWGIWNGHFFEQKGEQCTSFYPILHNLFLWE